MRISNWSSDVCSSDLAGDQDVHLQAEQAHRLLLAGFGHGGKLQVAGIDHGQRATALDFQHIVRADERGGVLVQADADRERVERQRRDQAAEAVALAEVLVDDEAVGQARSEERLVGKEWVGTDHFWWSSYL